MISKFSLLAGILLFIGTTPLPAEDARGNAGAATPSPAENWAVTPIQNTARDNYNFAQRHAGILEQKDALKPQIVLIGDSITMRWGGPPDKGGLRPSWKEAFGDIPTLNLGFGYDLTQNVLWRLDNGEFDGLSPKTVVILIGTNNMTGAPGSHGTNPEQTVEGIMAIIARVQAKSPQSKIIVTAVLPRGELPTNPFRPKIAEINATLAKALSAKPEIKLIDIGASFLQPDGTLPKSLMPDGTHPTEQGYSIWAKALVAAGVRD
jgi:lysophospholipase L1-like esterase